MPELTLSVQPKLEYLAHAYVKHEHCTNPGVCNICDGGLALCSVCGGLEGALLDVCPGVHLTEEQHDWNYRKFLSEAQRDVAAYQRKLRGY